MKRVIFAGVAVLTAGLSGLLAQQSATPPAAAAGAPAAKQPKIRSKAELQAVQALNTATGDPQAAIKAAEDLLSKFADTEYKEFALTVEANAYHQLRKDDDAQVMAERVLEMNPHSYLMENLVGEVIAPKIQEHDLNRAEEIAKATKMFNGAIVDVAAAPKPNQQMTDQAWADAQKYTIAESHNGLGILAQLDKKWDVAAKEYQMAADGDPEQDAYVTRLANADMMSGKKAEAVALCDKLLAKPNLHPTIKQMVTQIKTQASK